MNIDHGEAMPVEDDAKKKRRKIAGDIPYTSTPGKLKEILEKAIGAERPDTFNADFMETILGFKGGSATQTPPILKRAKLIDNGGHPTDLYSKFKTDSGRSSAAYEALRNAFPTIFAKNEYAHKANRDQIQDIIIEITGLEKDDTVLRAMIGTFEAIKSFIKGEIKQLDKELPNESDSDYSDERKIPPANSGKSEISLSNHIHIVLPNTTDIKVFNSIFKSIKENLMNE